jgi:hypothetical protein
MLGTLLLSGVLTAPTYFVAVDGSDTAAGTSRQPFQTISHALAAAAGKRASIVVQPGDYHIAKSLAVTSAHDGLTLQASKPGTVTLRGGIAVQSSDFRQVTGRRILDRLVDPEAKKHLLSISLAQHGVTNISGPVSRGFGQPRSIGPVELFINDQPMTLAKWPNEGFAKTGAVKGGETETPTVSVPGSRLEHWRLAEEPWAFGYWKWDWADGSMSITAIDAEKGTMTLSGKHPYPVEADKDFWVENLLEEIDAPGEYYVHRASGRLFLYPPENFEGADIEISTVEQTLIEITDAEDVRIEGLIIGPSRGTAVTVNGGRNVSIVGCTLQNLGTSGVMFRDGTDHSLQSCEVFNTGEGGAAMTAGDRKTLTPGNITIDNCHFKNFSRRTMTYRPAVSIGPAFRDHLRRQRPPD